MRYIWIVLLVTGVLYSKSQNLGSNSFDVSLWTNFISRQIESQLTVNLPSLKQSLHILGTHLIREFVSCFSKCHDMQWLDGSGNTLQSMELKLPCGAIGIGITPGNFTHRPVRLSWFIPHAPSTVINLTIEELSLPVLSVKCDYSYVKIDDGNSPSARLCGKQLNQTFYSGKDFVIELFVAMLANNANLCFSYSYGWYYETSVSNKDIHMIKTSLPAWMSPVSFDVLIDVNVKLKAPAIFSKGKFLLASYFLVHGQIMMVNISTGHSIIDLYDGPGRMSPLIGHLTEYSNMKLPVHFYLYLEFDMLSDDNITSIYYETGSDYFYPERNFQIVQNKLSLPCRNKYHWLQFDGTTEHADVTVKSAANTNIWCQVRAAGKGITLQLEEFRFDGPTLQYIHEDFNTMCQLGGVYIKRIPGFSSYKDFYMSLCDDSMPSNEELLVGDGHLDIYIVYFAGYGQGLATLKIKAGPESRAQIGQQCIGQQKECTFTHRIWTQNHVSSAGGEIFTEHIHAFQYINLPLVRWLQQYSTAHVSPVLHIMVGLPAGEINLGTVQFDIKISSTEPLSASCVHLINLVTIRGDSNTKTSHSDGVLLANKSIVIPSAKYISIKIQLCPYFSTGNRVIATVKVEKYMLCGVINHNSWPSQIAEDCANLLVPYHLGSVSFYTVLMHVYEITINAACVRKSCIEITVTGYNNDIDNTHRCHTIWEKLDVSDSPITITFLGKLSITWGTKPSCSATLEGLLRCGLKINILYNDLSYANVDRIEPEKMPDRIVLQRNTRKEIILPDQ